MRSISRPVRGAFVAVAVSVSAAATTPAAAAYGPAELLFTFADPAIVESSGIASSARSPGVFFTHNDSGDGARLFAVDIRGETLATITVEGALALDWEDMARGPGGDGQPSVFLADIGDNSRTRPFVTVYEIAEPVIDPAVAGATVSVQPAAVHHLVYEDGPRDAETLLVDPATGALAIVSKTATGLSGVYVAEELHPALPDVLRRVATINLNAAASPNPPGVFGFGRVLATGGDIAPAGDRVAVRTYNEVLEWAVPPAGLAAAFASAPLRVAIPATTQGEAVAYSSDGASLLTSSEGLNAPVHRVPGTA